jgi:hypothetical protein
MSRFLWAFAIFLIPVFAYAQEATVTGTVVDQTGGVLPGVTVTALHESSGNTFVAITDERGVYRLPVRVGTYRMNMELQGFANVAERFEALVGQTLTLNAQMKPSTVQESVTVTGEAPLIQTTSSTLAGNIDPRQTRDLPVNGGNWLDLSLLAPGNRSNGARSEHADGEESVRLSAQHRRPAGDQQRPFRRAEPARLARGGGGIPVRRQPLGRLARSIEWCARERGDEIRNERQYGQLLGKFPQRPIQRRGFRAAPGASVLESALQRYLRRSAQEGPRPLFCVLRARARAVHHHVQQPVPPRSTSTRNAMCSTGTAVRVLISRWARSST